MLPLLALLLAGTPGGAVPDALEGRFYDAGGNRDAAIDALLGELPFFKRPFARTQLLRATVPCKMVEIAEQADLLFIGCDDHTPAIATPNRTVTYADADGRRFQLTMRVLDDRIVQTFASPMGTRTNVYSIVGDGLRIDTKVESDRLPRPLEYSHSFRR